MYHLLLTLQPSTPLSASSGGTSAATPAFALGVELDDLFCLSTPSGAAARLILICGSSATTSTSVIDATAAAEGPLALGPGALSDSSTPSSDMNPFALSKTCSKPRQRGKCKASELFTPCSHGDSLAYDVPDTAIATAPATPSHHVLSASCGSTSATAKVDDGLAAELEALVEVFLSASASPSQPAFDDSKDGGASAAGAAGHEVLPSSQSATGVSQPAFDSGVESADDDDDDGLAAELDTLLFPGGMNQ